MQTSEIVIVGTGYVGLTSAACLAGLGHNVVGLDIDQAKVERLQQGQVEIHEAGLAELVESGLGSGRLRFTDDSQVVADASVILLCLPTPPAADGSPDTSAIAAAVGSMRDILKPGAVLVTKSTVPVGTHRLIEDWVDRDDVAVVSNPEFLREGTAVDDFMKPDRVVVGSSDTVAAKTVAALYEGLDTAVLVTDAMSAELIKYAANTFLATKLSFVNEMARLCDAAGANVDDVVAGLASDARISPLFLRPGPGWGGSCFPKDTRGLAQAARSTKLRLAVTEAAAESNREHLEHVTSRIADAVRRPLHQATIAVWGLAFKAGTDDTRSSPAIELIGRLRGAHATVRAYDPVASVGPDVVETGDMYEICQDADMLLVTTEWPEFGAADPAEIAERLALPVVFDTRNVIDVSAAGKAGLTVHRLGRPTV